MYLTLPSFYLIPKIISYLYSQLGGETPMLILYKKKCVTTYRIRRIK